MNSFKVEIDGKEQEFYVREPSIKDQQEAQKIYNVAFNEALESQAILRIKLDDFVREQGIWDDKKEIRFKELQKKLSDAELKLAKGGFKLQEARNLAINMRVTRNELRELLSSRMDYDNVTVEAQADNARFNYLVSVCTLTKDKQKYFKNYEDFLNDSGTNSVAYAASQKLASIAYGLDGDFEKNLPENKFLIEFHFANNDLRLVNQEGKYVNRDGHLIDNNGRLINEQGQYIDSDGNLLDKDGNFLVDRQPFLDDDGTPIVENVESEDSVEELLGDVVKESSEPTLQTQ